MAVEMTFTPPLKFVERQQGRFREVLEDLTGLWARFIPIVEAMELSWFESEGQGAWPPLAESTLRQKAAKGFSLAPLRTDDRAESLYRTLVDPQQAAQIGPRSLTWGTSVPYAGYHQDGGEIAGRPPQRQVIPDPLPLENRRQLEAATVSWLNEQAAIAFGRG